MLGFLFATLAEIRDLSAAYRALTEAYDEELRQAHHAEHGTAAMIRHLRAANDLAPEMMEALRKYQAAVAALASQSRSTAR